MNKRNAGLPEELQIDRIDLMQFIPQVLGNEVFTPEDIVENVLNCLPDTVWTNRDNKFLDIYTDNGEFLVQIYFKLMEGLKEAIPDPVSRRTHILMTQLYAVTSSTQLAAMTRRRLYNEFSLEGNIGVIEGYKNKMKSDRESLIGIIERMFGDDMKFDVIVGNPPYQEMSSNKSRGTDGAMPLYHHFVAGAMKLNPSYISMIVPSRWMQGGMSVLDDFRNTMVECGHVTEIYNFNKSKDIFDDVDIAGGVMYFLYDANAHTKEVNMVNCKKNGLGINTKSWKRDISKFKYDTRGNKSNYMIIVDNEAVEIANKALALNEVRMDKLVLPISPFGILSNFEDSSIKTESKTIKVICSKGRITYTDKKHVVGNENIIDKWKVCIGKVTSGSAGICKEGEKLSVVSRPNILAPGEICSITYLVIGSFKTEIEAKNYIDYISTKFVRYLVSLTISGMNMSSRSYMFVPVQDYSKTWTDQELYEKYNLSPEEIGVIENKIKAWE